MVVPAQRLHPGVVLEVDVTDRTRFGSPLSPKPDRSTREVFAAVLDHVAAHGPAALVADGPRLLAEVVRSPGFGAIADVAPDGTWAVHDDVLHPDPDLVTFTGLRVIGPDGRVLEVGVPEEDWPAVHVLMAGLASAAGFTADELADAPGPASARSHAAALLDALTGAGWVVPADPDGPDADAGGSALADEPGLLFAGHNLVVVAGERARVVVDPYLRPAVASDASGYRALRWSELGRVDAVLITHSHPDHFAPGTLLQIDPATTIVVPRVGRETVLSIDMTRRLRELGFTDVVELGWHETVTVGDVVVEALPFLGEQPTDGTFLHPDVRNAGNTYLVRTPHLSAALLADSGRDHLGGAVDVAAAARSRSGPVDVVFCGYRGWRTYAAQLLFTSVSRYLLFVPPDRWDNRMRLMNDLDEAVDVAERWGARYLVPYADGGAPWFWEIGLGPRLDDEAAELEGFDPFPERVADAAARRVRVPSAGFVASPVEVRLLRPNDALVGWPDPKVVRDPANAWPYAEPASAAARHPAPS